MKTIWKYPVPISSSFLLEMPRGATLLDVQVQHGAPYLWAMVDPTAAKVGRVLHVHGTGKGIHEPSGSYVGSFQLAGGELVFHVFSGGEVAG